MIRNYLKVAFRNFFRYRIFSIINLTGLALGLSCAIFIFLWIRDELAYDAFHANGQRLYRVMANVRYADGIPQTAPSTPAILAEALKTEVAGISHAAQATWEVSELLSSDLGAHRERGRYVSPDFLTMFTFPLALGDATTALAQPNSIVISKGLATRYFANENPIGQTIRLNNEFNFTVTGVLAEIPRQSSIRFDYLLPFDNWLSDNEWARVWENHGPGTYIMLSENVKRDEVESKVAGFIKRKLPGATVDLFLQPVPEMYLHSEWKNGKEDGGRIDYVNAFSVVGVVVLVIASINFMNLSTAQSLKRSREIGIRKVNGAARRSLIAQFIGESLVFTAISLPASLLTVELLLPGFRLLTEKNIVLPYADPVFWTAIIGATLVTGLISGSYPAFFLSSFNIIRVLKGNLRFNTGAVSVRKTLVVFQFGLTIVLVISSLVVFRQMEFIRSKKLGFDRENLILINMDGDFSSAPERALNEALRLPGVRYATLSTTSPLHGGDNTIAVKWPGKGADEQVSFTQMAVGYDYIQTMGIDLTEGRDFSRAAPGDSTAYIINEETARRMRLTEPLGETITFWGTPGKIIGVMKDYHTSSLHSPIAPVILHLHPWWANVMIVRTDPGDPQRVIDGLQKLSEQLNPAYPFEYQFVDDTFEQHYKNEALAGRLSLYFTFLAIFISCLGLSGLIMFSAEQRSKEVGIRKVLGASVQSILLLLSRDFMVMIVIAFAFSAPLSWLVMTDWLDQFAFHITVDWTIFLAAALLSGLLALATVSIQAIGAATTNPVKALRSE